MLVPHPLSEKSNEGTSQRQVNPRPKIPDSTAPAPTTPTSQSAVKESAELYLSTGVRVYPICPPAALVSGVKIEQRHDKSTENIAQVTAGNLSSKSTDAVSMIKDPV